MKQFRARNTWRYCIQNNIREIVRDLKGLDTDKTYHSDPSAFMKILYKRVKAPEALKEHSDMLHDYVLSFIDNNNKINYAAMGIDLQTFNFDKETNEGILPKSSHSITSGRLSIQGGSEP